MNQEVLPIPIPGAGHLHDLVPCGSCCPPHEHLGKTLLSCQRPLGHAGPHQRIRRRDFYVEAAWDGDRWVKEPAE